MPFDLSAEALSVRQVWARLLYFRRMSIQRNKAYVHPHQKADIADYLGIPLRTVKRAIARLADLRLIAIVRTQQGNRYYFLDPSEGRDSVGGGGKDVTRGDDSAAHDPGVSDACPAAAEDLSTIPPDRPDLLGGATSGTSEGPPVALPRGHQWHFRGATSGTSEGPPVALPRGHLGDSRPYILNQRDKYSSSADLAAAADLFAPLENQDAATALFALDVPQPLISQLLETHGPEFALLAATFCAERFRAKGLPPVRNRLGFLRALFRDPGAYAFSQVNGHWQLPPPSEKPPNEAAERLNDRLRRNAEAAQKLREDARKTSPLTFAEALAEREARKKGEGRS